MKSELRPAFYSLPAGAWRDLVTLLHLPYTAWHLSYVVLGAAAAPAVHLERVGWLALAFLLAVGLAAHALDEFQGRPLRTQLSSAWLLSIAGSSLAAAIGIGVLASLAISLWAVSFVLFGGFMVVAYNLELFGGKFHSDAWFAVAWGAFPALTGYWANAERLDFQALLIAAACFWANPGPADVKQPSQRAAKGRAARLRPHRVLRRARRGRYATLSAVHT